MAKHKIRVEPMDESPVCQRVFLDDEDISSAIKGAAIFLEVGELPSVQLDVVSIAGTRVPDQTRDLLIKMGWTPPTDPTDE